MFLPIRDSRFVSKKTKMFCCETTPKTSQAAVFIHFIQEHNVQRKKKSLCKFSRTNWLNEPWAENIWQHLQMFTSLIVIYESPKTHLGVQPEKSLVVYVLNAGVMWLQRHMKPLFCMIYITLKQIPFYRPL